MSQKEEIKRTCKKVSPIKRSMSTTEDHNRKDQKSGIKKIERLKREKLSEKEEGRGSRNVLKLNTFVLIYEIVSSIGTPAGNRFFLSQSMSP